MRPAVGPGRALARENPDGRNTLSKNAPLLGIIIAAVIALGVELPDDGGIPCI
jgi:hypothetical protein